MAFCNEFQSKFHNYLTTNELQTTLKQHLF